MKIDSLLKLKICQKLVWGKFLVQTAPKLNTTCLNPVTGMKLCFDRPTLVLDGLKIDKTLFEKNQNSF